MINAELYVAVFAIATVLILAVSIYFTPNALTKHFKEQIKIDVSLNQMKAAEARVSLFLECNNLPVGASLDDIAKALHIVDSGVESGMVGRARLGKPNQNGDMQAVFKFGLTKEEYRFDFAHECAHQINGDTPPNTRPGGKNKPKVEQLADYTAAALLMPESLVYEALIEFDYAHANAEQRYDFVRKLCKKYTVSEIIALRRIKEICKLHKLKMDA